MNNIALSLAKSLRAALSGIGVAAFVFVLTVTDSHSQLACPQGYNLEVFEHTGDVQTFELPEDSSEVIVRAIGASGGSSGTGTGFKEGGAGALIEGTFAVSGGEMLQVLVGGAGSPWPAGSGGGGGGGATLVGEGASLATVSPWVIAGGGGGAGRGTDAVGGDGGVPGPTVAPSGTSGGTGGTDGGDGGAGGTGGESGGAGGAAGNGGQGTSVCGAAGGAGLETNGSGGNETSDAIALRDGGAASTHDSLADFYGGFGGGGAPSNCGGGGGGYSGGGAGGNGDSGNVTQGAGGGGGSLNNGSDPFDDAGFNGTDADGLVELCFNGTLGGPAPGPVAVPVRSLTGTLALALMLLLTGWILVRR